MADPIKIAFERKILTLPIADLLLTKALPAGVRDTVKYRRISAHAERFIRTGAMLLTTWFDDPLRPTRDLDLLGFGDPDPDAMQATFREIIAIEVDDGVLFKRMLPDGARVGTVDKFQGQEARSCSSPWRPRAARMSRATSSSSTAGTASR